MTFSVTEQEQEESRFVGVGFPENQTLLCITLYFQTFPWIIETFQLEPFYFFKVIEVLIRAEEGLVRDVVKHLQRIEEQILESLAWTSTSPVWNLVAGEVGGQVPSQETPKETWLLP